MSRINPNHYESIVYITSGDSATGKTYGSGFLFGIPNQSTQGLYVVVIVTCRHLLKGTQAIVRINTKDGYRKDIQTEINEWHQDATEDLAIYNLVLDDEMKNVFIRYDHDAFHGDMIERLGIGHGDDAYIIGRFVNHDGDFSGHPLVRSGSIAMVPSEPIYNDEIGIGNPAYLVDCNFREGFSGCPVFVQYRGRTSRSGSQSSGPWSGDRLLGIAWGAITKYQHIQDHDKKDLVGALVSLQEGLAIVILVDKIFDLVQRNFPKLIGD